MYRNIESLCCITGTNTVLYVNFTSKTKKLKGKKSDLWLPEARRGGRGNWTKIVKRYKLPVIR